MILLRDQWTIYVPESDTIHRSMDHIWSFTYTNNSFQPNSLKAFEINVDGAA